MKERYFSECLDNWKAMMCKKITCKECKQLDEGQIKNNHCCGGRYAV